MANLSIKNFEFSGKEKKFSLILLVVGLLLFVLGAFMNMGNPTRIWATLVYNNYFFLMISLSALFFVAANSIGYSGWFIAVRRIYEAITTFVPVAAMLMLGIVLVGGSHVYHWMDADLVNPASPKYDEIIVSKQWWLNMPFYWGRAVVYVAIWTLLAVLIRKNSTSTDLNPSLAAYQRGKYMSAAYIVFFAVTSSTSSWDYMMSIQPHWYSTLWGWYTFISSFVTMHSIVMLLFIHLRSNGYLPYVNDSHQHDIGKFMFGFSIAWAYLFYSQFMLIWYANMPEETIYFRERISHYGWTMYAIFMLNFIFPFFILLTRGAKRSATTVVIMACLIIFGHWLDFYQMAIPGALANMHHAGGAHGGHAEYWHGGGVGLIDIGLLLTYAGALSYWVLNALSKAALLPVGHPFAKESLYHQI